MRELVLDASVVLKWFVAGDETGHRQAVSLRTEYQRGDSTIACPALLFLEILNVAGRSWKWDAASLNQLALALEDLGFEVIDSDLPGVAHWTTQGLTAYDAAYVALAEDRGIPLISDDTLILSIAKNVALPLVPAAHSRRR